MRIYNRIVMNIATGEIIEEDSYEYSGEIAECKGGTTSTTSVDPVYNDRMATIAETNQKYADEMYYMFKWGVPYDPYQSSGQKYKTGKQIENPEYTAWKERSDAYNEAARDYSGLQEGGGGSNMPPNPGAEPPKMIDEEIDKTNAEVFGYDFDNPPVSEMQLMQKQIEAQATLIPQETEAKMAQLQLQTESAKGALSLVPKRTELASKMYDEAMTGVNVEERVAQARSGVMQDFAKTTDITARNLSRMGLDPSSGAGRGAIVNAGIEQAKALSGASTAAKTGAEAENFQRKVTALGTGV